jgi:hypothetical protein
MMTKKVCGITLLFAYMQSSYDLIEAQLKSYVISFIDWDNLNYIAKELASKVCENALENESIQYLGIEDVFYVSGCFKQFEILGKSYITECNTINKAQKLLLDEKNYSFNKSGLSSTSMWYLVCLLYFYHDKNINDKLTISCNTPVYSESIKTIKELILETANKEDFIKKIVTKSLDEMDYNNLKYIGVENIYSIEEDPVNNGAFQISYKDFNNIHEIKNILPDESNLKESFLLITEKG